jgi:HAE1 family hydrophobic/amphiphilic exporter-1
MNTTTQREGRAFDPFRLAIARPIGFGVVFATLIVIGLLAYLRIPLQLLPSGFAEPQLNCWIAHPGSSARENEEQVTRPIEEELRTLAGLRRVRSWSREGAVSLRISFDPLLDPDLMKAEIRDRLERARPKLPSSVGEINFWSEDADQMPISFFGVLYAQESERTDFLLEEVVVPRLEAVDGISRIEVWGVLEDTVRILLDEDRVAATGTDIGDLVRRLSSDNFAEPLGNVTDGGQELLLRSDMRFETLADIEAYPISRDLTIGDIGRVVRVKSVRNQLTRIDGRYAYYGVASKEAGANVVETSRALVAAMAEIEQDPRLAGNFSFMPFFVQGELVENSLSQLRGTAVWGGALAVVVLLVFLRRVRLTLAVALCVPVSALLAIAWEYFSGGSFNLLTMVGITLAMGMLVDNAVVVVENITRHRDLGLPAREAARVGVKEIALAVSLSTLTTVVVFMPLVFMTENPMARVFMRGLGLPLSISLLFSLLIAVVFLPTLAARILGPQPHWLGRAASSLVWVWRLPALVTIALVRLARRLAWLAAHAFHAPVRVARAVLAPSGALRWPVRALRLAGAVVLVLRGFGHDAEVVRRGAVLGREAAAGLGSGAAVGIAAALAVLVVPELLALRRRRAPAAPAPFRPGTTSLMELAARANQGLVTWSLENRLLACSVAFLALASVAVPLSNLKLSAFTQDQESDSVRYWVDFTSDFTLAEASEEIALHEDFLDSQREALGIAHVSSRFSNEDGSITAYWDKPLTPSELRRVEKVLREGAPRPAGHDVSFSDSEAATELSRDVAFFVLRGPDSEQLEEYGRAAIELLSKVDGLGKVSSESLANERSVEVDIDRDKALALGVTSRAALENISWALRGASLARFHEEGREVPFIMEFDSEEVAGLSTLRDLSLFTESGRVSLASVSDVSFERTSRTIYRDDGRTTFEITAEVLDPTRIVELTEAGYAALAALDLPRGYSAGSERSTSRRAEEEAGEMLRALALSIVLVFLLMGVLFESLVLPFCVLVTIPFAFLGAMWMVFVTGTPMDIMGWIGLIVLAGVVVNNGIVLIDCVHRLRAEEPDRTKAVVTAAVQRLRPILMTAATTVFGLVPMIVEEPPKNSIPYNALGAIVAGGLTASTFFTLWVVPLAYTLIDDARLAFTATTRRAVLRLRGRAAAAPAASDAARA